MAIPAVLYFLRAPEPAPQMRLELSLPGSIGQPLISPDGRTIAYLVQPPDGKRMLWIRPVDSDVGQQLGGTEDANGVFWAPDSKRLAFLSQGKLMKIEISGGTRQILGDVGPSLRGADWSESGDIFLSERPTTSSRRFPILAGRSLH